ncbi:TetR/AcrR family transcriptional regulator [Kibdelosporangium lantanae]
MRTDAARNRDKLLAAAAHEFGAHGLDAPLEHIAKRAGVSIGTLYNHFPTREDFFNALLPERLGPALTEIGTKALATADPWEGFVSYLVGLYELQAHDRALNDAISQRIPLSAEVLAACHQGLEHVTRVIDRAKASGQLRADYSPTDLPPLSAAMSRVITEFPNDWRRFLAHYVDGLRATEHTGRPSSGHNLSLTGRTAEPRPE